MATDKHLESADYNKAIPKVTAEKFKIVNMKNRTSMVVEFPVFGKIDFRTLSVRRAEQLVAQKAPFIEKKKKSEV